MKKVLSSIDFTNACFEFSHEENLNFTIYLNYIDRKTLNVVFNNTIKLTFNRSNQIKGMYEIIDEDTFLTEAIASHYKIITKEHPFKYFVILGINDYPIFKIIAEKCSFKEMQ